MYAYAGRSLGLQGSFCTVIYGIGISGNVAVIKRLWHNSRKDRLGIRQRALVWRCFPPPHLPTAVLLGGQFNAIAQRHRQASTKRDLPRLRTLTDPFHQNGFRLFLSRDIAKTIRLYYLNAVGPS